MVRRSRNWREHYFVGNLLTGFLFLFLIFLHATVIASDVEMTGFRIVQETGNGRWEILADKAYYDGRGDVILQKVSARMIKDGVEGVMASSDKGRYESKGLILHLEGNVTVVSSWGSRFEAPNLSWDGPQALIVAERGVRLERGMLRVMGESARYTVNTGTALVGGGVTTTWDERSAPH